ncbi:hypothetical protein GW17_00021741 [Ensete ventricosum]|nr:hypothetical protein GW17_00021741 [Ensete ventricosum]
MGCFPCFESKEGAQLGHGNQSDRKREEQPMVAPRVEKLSLGNFRSECFLGEGGFGRVYRGRLESTGQSPLDWNTRMKIAAGAAKGLEYLHDKANPPVIYRDLKASNILLDKGFHPKLSDFGLAKLGPVGDKSHVSTRVMGTYGYCAPEYALTGQLTVKSDVYSFGVVLLELITGRKAIDSTKSHAEQNLVSWVRPMFKERRKLPGLADPKLQGRFPMRGLYQALAVASMCIQEEAASRPVIADVVTALSYLASQAYDPGAASAVNNRPSSERSRGGGEEDAKLTARINNINPGHMRQMNSEDSSKETVAILRHNFDRERALAEAKMWGQNWREKTQAKANVDGSFDVANAIG